MKLIMGNFICNKSDKSDLFIERCVGRDFGTPTSLLSAWEVSFLWLSLFIVQTCSSMPFGRMLLIIQGGREVASFCWGLD